MPYADFSRFGFSVFVSGVFLVWDFVILELELFCTCCRCILHLWTVVDR